MSQTILRVRCTRVLQLYVTYSSYRFTNANSTKIKFHVIYFFAIQLHASLKVERHARIEK